MATTQENLRKALRQFYQNPVAKVSLELFLSLGAVIFFALFAIRPTLLTMSDLLKEIEDKEDLSLQLERKVAALATVQSEYLQNQSRLEVLDESMPNSPQLVYSLKVIEKLAGDNQLAVEGIAVSTLPDERVAAFTYETIQRIDLPATVTVTGNYPNIRQFIEDLQSYRRSVIVDTIIFSSTEERGNTKLTANLSMYLPYFTVGTPKKTAATRQTDSAAQAESVEDEP